MKNTDMTPMYAAKQQWFRSLIDDLLSSGLNKTQIASKMNFIPQRLTNLLNGSDAISDKIIDAFIETFNLGKITLLTNRFNSEGHSAGKEGERAIDRLEYYLLLCGISEEQATVNARLDADTMRTIREENRDLTEKEIAAFAKTFPDLNEEWLRSGKGEMRNGYALPIENRKQPMARILELLNEEGITLEEFAKIANSKFASSGNKSKWPIDSRSLILGSDKAIHEWIDSFCNLFPKYSKFWILTGKTGKYNYPQTDQPNERQ